MSTYDLGIIVCFTKVGLVVDFFWILEIVEDIIVSAVTPGAMLNALCKLIFLKDFIYS